jgi:D-alanyl-lipoteichoic acid acyltransferase DltB (MBOAT superfamily)
MLFSSIPFVILFLPATLLLYYCCPFIKWKNLILLFTSLIFYAWGEPKFVLIMIFSIIMNYSVGLLVGKEPAAISKRKIYLAIGISLNLLVLFVFKYLGFFEQIINSLGRILHLPGFQLTVHQLVLPLGISFYTFQSLSYLIDVYRTPSLVQKNILNLGLFISFFPQLIAGPIVRYHDINEQIKDRGHSLGMFACGIERFIVGLAKKVLIANTLAEAVDGILNIPYSEVPSIYLLLVILAGALQLYYDFSGYSDMAIGLGRMFGFKIMENFDYPLFAKTASELWRRWHISLTTWFRDYVYFPLGGSRKGRRRQIINVLIVFTLVGLWHGASYNFIFFGFACGLIVMFERPVMAQIDTLSVIIKGKAGKIIISVLTFICVVGTRIALFMFFRLDMKDSLSFYASMFNFFRNIPVPTDVLFLTDMRFYIFFVAAIAFSFPWWRKLHIPQNPATVSIKYILLLCLFVFSFGTLTSDAYNPFIYFRF